MKETMSDKQHISTASPNSWQLPELPNSEITERKNRFRSATLHTKAPRAVWITVRKAIACEFLVKQKQLDFTKKETVRNKFSLKG